MPYNELKKGAVYAGVALSISMIPTAGNAMAAGVGTENQMVGMALNPLQPTLIAGGTTNNGSTLPVTSPALAVSQSAVTVTPGAIEAASEKPKKESPYEKTAISTASDYVCIRKKPSIKSEMVGKMPKGSSAHVKSVKKGWAKVKSGKITGYVKTKYLAIGKKAEKIAKKYKVHYATVKTDALNVREGKSKKSQVIGSVNKGTRVKVVKQYDKWVAVNVNGKKGYLSKDFVKVKTSFKKAVSSETSTVNVNGQSLKRVTVKRGSLSSNTKTASQISAEAASRGTAVVRYALQYVGNPYQWGGTSLTHGADCSGFVQSIMSKFGISLPRDSRSQSGVGKNVSVSDAKPGDLVFYARNGRINHVAICIGGGRIVAAANERYGIRTSNMYYRQPVCVKRVIS